jgi:hypothetical protein
MPGFSSLGSAATGAGAPSNPDIAKPLPGFSVPTHAGLGLGPPWDTYPGTPSLGASNLGKSAFGGFGLGPPGSGLGASSVSAPAPVTPAAGTPALGTPGFASNASPPVGGLLNPTSGITSAGFGFPALAGGAPGNLGRSANSEKLDPPAATGVANPFAFRPVCMSCSFNGVVDCLGLP